MSAAMGRLEHLLLGGWPFAVPTYSGERRAPHHAAAARDTGRSPALVTARNGQTFDVALSAEQAAVQRWAGREVVAR